MYIVYDFDYFILIIMDGRGFIDQYCFLNATIKRHFVIMQIVYIFFNNWCGVPNRLRKYSLNSI